MNLNVLYTRLRTAGDPDEQRKQMQRLLLNDTVRTLPYLEEGQQIFNEPSLIFGAFREKMSFFIDRLPVSPETEAIRRQWGADDPEEAEKALIALKIFAANHPDLETRFPMLGIVQTLPEGFGFIAFMNGRSVTDLDSKPLQKQAKRLGIKIHKTTPGNNGSCSTDNIIALHFALGSLLPLAKFEHNLKKTHASDKPLDLKGMVRRYKAAQKVYGKAWEKKYPEDLRVMQKTIAHLEWTDSNEWWTSDEEKALFESMKEMEDVLKTVSMEARNGKIEMEWKFFLKKLWEEERLLREQLEKELQLDNKLKDILQKLFGNPADPRLEKTFYKIGSLYRWNASETPWIPENYAQHGRSMIQDFGWEWGHQGKDEKKIQEIFRQGIFEILWEEILKFKAALQKKVAEPHLFERACQFEEGFYRDFLLNEAWKQEPHKTREHAERYLEVMQKAVPDGAKANRATDLMNRYVKDHYQEGTEENVSYNDVYKHVNQWSASEKEIKDTLKLLHRQHKQEMREKCEKDMVPSGRDLYLFSDAASRKPGQEVVTEKSFAVRLAAQFANADLEGLKQKLLAGTLDVKDVDRAKDWVMNKLPEACMLRDFYLENYLNLILWEHLQRSRLGNSLAQEGIKLKTSDVDLEAHFAGKDDGVLGDAYFTRYPLFRVEGLAPKIQLFNEREQEAMANLLRTFSMDMTTATAESVDRIAIELEATTLKKQYALEYRNALPLGRKANDAEDNAARDQAFNTVFQRILTLFPLASYNRDELLERFALDHATTHEHARRIEEATYGYLVRRPDVAEKKKENVVFAPAEAVKSYLAVFKDRKSRSVVLGWIFGGELPDDRYLEALSFSVNADEEREVFWLMSSAERRAVLYNALMGTDGLFEVASEWPPGPTLPLHDSPQEIFLNFLEVFYTENFGALLKKEESEEDTMEPVLRTIFFEIFKHYSTPRRVELFLALTEKMREVRQKGKKLTAAQSIRLFLEQVGVVGIKAGQVISEQKGMVSDEVREELSSLRDQAAPFSKFGVFTYLRLAGLLGDSGKGVHPPFRVAQVGECLGSASIKQAHLAWTSERQPVVVKVPRPTISKNYPEDIAVLEKVLVKLREEGTPFPEFLLDEIVDACRNEFDFAHEGTAQQEADAHLYKRKAQIKLEPSGESVRFDIPDLAFLLRKGESRIESLQMMVDEYVGGFSLNEIEEWQTLTAKTPASPEAEARKEGLEKKLERIYAEHAMLIGQEYSALSVPGLRAQIGLDLVQQILGDGLFHADLHAGNIILDLTPQKKRAAMIDFGSVGRSVEITEKGSTDHRPAFREFLRNLMFLKMGVADAAGMGKVVASYVQLEGYDAARWTEVIQKLSENEPGLEGFFKGLTTEILGKKGQINLQFKMLLKALAAAGGHFEALGNLVKTSPQSLQGNEKLKLLFG